MGREGGGNPADLALWPGSEIHLGLGLWRALPQGWWFVELSLIALAGAYYLAKARDSSAFGGRARAVLAVVVVLHVLNSPWLSAM